MMSCHDEVAMYRICNVTISDSDVLQQVWRVDLLFRLAALRVDQRTLGVVRRAQDDLIAEGRGLRLATIQRVTWGTQKARFNSKRTTRVTYMYESGLT